MFINQTIMCLEVIDTVVFIVWVPLLVRGGFNPWNSFGHDLLCRQIWYQSLGNKNWS